MNMNFLSLVEQKWRSLCAPHSAILRQNRLSEKSSGQLIIEIETSEAKARVAAREALRSLDITVSRFKDDRVIAQGTCRTDAEVEPKLRKLIIDLTASPFAG